MIKFLELAWFVTIFLILSQVILPLLWRSRFKFFWLFRKAGIDSALGLADQVEQASKAKRDAEEKIEQARRNLDSVRKQTDDLADKLD